ncbi:hypothetical protein TNIN_23731 [Trichonephila inaurata madagascariensis]|uniref:Uncharacterized protein n=1 Tax=Trichonephila inaurata madagascariensis TaxID=2747483 RepID=A0A8X7CLI3_9ARAC|nr:hypothetical protein TNIN_23731 [Trichonephila inaurata madagascariensis]
MGNTYDFSSAVESELTKDVITRGWADQFTRDMDKISLDTVHKRKNMASVGGAEMKPQLLWNGGSDGRGFFIHNQSLRVWSAALLWNYSPRAALWFGVSRLGFGASAISG